MIIHQLNGLQGILAEAEAPDKQILVRPLGVEPKTFRSVV